MSFKFPPKEVFEKMLSLLSKADIERIRRNYQKEVLEEKICDTVRESCKPNKRKI